MATSSCSRVECVGIVSDSFYFEALETTTDVFMDSFNINTRSCRAYWVRSKDNKFLLIDHEQQFRAQNLTSQQLCQPECKFKIQVYTDFEDVHGDKKTPAMLYVKNDDKIMVACCRGETEVYPEQMEALPTRIESNKHKALFFMSELTAAHTYEFESSEYPSWFLGFQRDRENPSKNELVLLHKCEDEVDESCQVILCN
ncbi:interleukin-18-like [Clinocottus analis]|uniref:interleukin-18-like n=1 Tax=Clinocottus analis TaxID=304258 RepID=UPI0035BEDD12